MTPRPAITPLKATLEAARRGLLPALPQLKKVLDEHPEIWGSYGDLARQAEQAWLDRIAGTNLLHGQSLRHQVEKMRVELCGSGSTANPLDRLLVDRLIVSWLAAQHAELAEAVAPHADAGQVAQLRLKRAESANRRLLSAAKTLAQVRRMAAGIRIEIEHKSAAPQEPVGAGATTTGGRGRLGRLFAAGAGTARVGVHEVEDAPC